MRKIIDNDLLLKLNIANKKQLVEKLKKLSNIFLVAKTDKRLLKFIKDKNHNLVFIDDQLTYNLGKDSYNISENSISKNGKEIFSIDSSNNIEKYLSDEWDEIISPVITIFNEYNVKKEEEEEKLIEKIEKAKEERKKRDFNLSYDKQLVNFIEKREKKQKIKETTKNLLFVFLFLIGFVVVILVFILAGWWGLLIVPVIILPIFWGIYTLIDGMFPAKDEILLSDSKFSENKEIMKDYNFENEDLEVYDNEVKEIAESYDIEKEEAEKVRDLADELGIDYDDAVELKDEL